MDRITPHYRPEKKQEEDRAFGDSQFSALYRELHARERKRSARYLYCVIAIVLALVAATAILSGGWLQ